ncbi:MAG TPA: hypothetical protein VEA99_17620 [Gemmatimonadaceae bacterium]|nr:hypothetical protein [Gemmatimonadaceae bacterium]
MTSLLVEDDVTLPGVVAAINGVRTVRGGAVFVNDRANRRLVMLDGTLRLRRVVLDATPATGGGYGRFATRLIALSGDSTGFLDGASRTLTVIDAEGRVARRMTVPPEADLDALLRSSPTVDARGRLVYRGRGLSQRELLQMGELGVRATPEEVPLLRLDLATGRVDTAATLQIYQQQEKLVPVANGVSVQPVLHPAPTVDEWAMLSDGRIAVVRGAEYRVEFIAADDRIEGGEPVREPRPALDVTAKSALLASSRATRRAMMAAGYPLGREVAPLPGAVFLSAPGTCVVTRASDGKEVAPIFGCGDAAADEWVRPDEVADRLPAFLPGAVRADADGRAWVQRITLDAADNGLLHDVIGSSGQRIDRVRLPVGTVIVGFLANGGVLLATRDRGVLRLRRARYVPPRPLM